MPISQYLPSISGSTVNRSLRLLLLSLSLLLVPVALWADAEDEFNLARNLFRDAGDHATAAQLFGEFIRNHPADPHLPDARLMLAQSYSRSGRCAEAVGAYHTFYEAHPKHLEAADARREQAACYEALGEPARAGAVYEEVQRLYSEAGFAAESLLAAATNFVRAGDLSNGLRAYSKLLNNYDGHGAARRGRYQLAQLQFASGHPVEARELLAQITASASTSDESRDALLLSGRLELFLGRVAAATSQFEQLQSAFKGSAHADSSRLDLAAHFSSRGQYDQAEKSYDQAARQTKDATLQARARLGRATALQNGGRHEDALAVYRELMTSDAAASLRDDVRLGLAVSLGWLSQVGPAVGELFQLVPTSSAPPSPAGAAALRELGALYRRQGDLARAISWLRRYLDEAKRHGEAFAESSAKQDLARLQLAEVYGASGYHDEAVELFTALSRDSGLRAEGQYGLAGAYEGGGQRRLAVREYVNFLEQYPGHRRSAQVRDRVEYLQEFTVRDAEGLARALQQAVIDDLSGSPRRQVRFELAVALRHHQDFSNAVRAWEAYVSAYPGDPTAQESQFYLADCLYRLARQRQLEGESAQADSLRDLARQEDRILAHAELPTRWARLAQLRQVERAAALATSDSARYRVEEDGYTAIVSSLADGPESTESRARALLGLGDARRHSAASDTTRRAAAIEAYQSLLKDNGDHPLAARARFGLAVAALDGGQAAMAIDSLTALLHDVPGSSLQPQILAVLGEALRQAGRSRDAASRFGELLLAFPTFEGRRQAEEQLADTYLEIGEYVRATELFERLGASDPASDIDGSLRRRLARAHFQAGQFEQSLSIYDALLAEGITADDSVHVARGDALSRLDRTQQAIDAYSQVRRTAAVGPRAARLAADLRFATGDYAAAATAFGKLIDSDEADAALLGRWVLALYEQADDAAAKKARNTFGKRFGKDLPPWTFLFELSAAQRRLANREYDKAFDLFTELAQDTDSTGYDVSALGSAVPVELARAVSNPSAAVAYYAATSRWEQMRRDPSEDGATIAVKLQGDFLRDHGASPFAPNVRLRLGDFHAALGSFRPASGAYRDVLEGSQATPAQRQTAIWKLIQCYQKLTEHDDQLRVSRRLLVEFPDHPQRRSAELAIGIIYEETGRYPEAIDYLTKVLEWAEGDDAAEARFHIGKSYQKRGDYGPAIKAFYEVSYHGADASTNWIISADFERARCYEELGQPETARSVYEKIIRTAGASSAFGQHAQERLDALSR